MTHVNPDWIPSNYTEREECVRQDVEAVTNCDYRTIRVTGEHTEGVARPEATRQSNFNSPEQHTFWNVLAEPPTRTNVNPLTCAIRR